MHNHLDIHILSHPNIENRAKTIQTCVQIKGSVHIFRTPCIFATWQTLIEFCLQVWKYMYTVTSHVFRLGSISLNQLSSNSLPHFLPPHSIGPVTILCSYRVFIKYCFFPKILWFLWTLLVLLQCWCLICHGVHTLTPRGNRERPESRIYFKIFEKTTYFMNTLYKIWIQ